MGHKSHLNGPTTNEQKLASSRRLDQDLIAVREHVRHATAVAILDVAGQDRIAAIWTK
jgi:hypothetical protein